MPDPQTIAADKLCALTGLTDRRHRQLAGDGYFPPPIKGQYVLAATLQGMFRYYRESMAKREQAPQGDDLKYKNARARRELAEAQQAEMEMERIRKNLLDADQVFTAWESIILPAKQRFQTIPSKIQSRLSLTPTQSAIVAQEIDEALAEISKEPDYDAAAAALPDEESAEAVHA